MFDLTQPNIYLLFTTTSTTNRHGAHTDKRLSDIQPATSDLFGLVDARDVRVYTCRRSVDKNGAHDYKITR